MNRPYVNRTSELTYTPAWWVPGAHLQTLWGKVARRPPEVPTRLERWTTPDGDFLELHRLDGTPDAPRLLLLHGLEGTIRSHYLKGMLGLARQRGWAADILIFRGCGSEMNTARRMYHSGETTDLDFVIRRLVSENPDQPLVAAAFSLGGNVLLKWLGEKGTAAPEQLRAAAAMSVPFDLEAGCRHIETGFSRIYGRHFLRTLRVKATAKLQQFPGAFRQDEMERARTLFEFDDAVTAPLHGFQNAHDYYSRSSCLSFLANVCVQTLLLSAVDDPFLPRKVLDSVRLVARENRRLKVEFHRRGGHVGFVSGRVPGRGVFFGEGRIFAFLERSLVNDGGNLLSSSL